MSKKLIYLVSFVLLLGLTNMVSAQIVEDFESGGFSTFNWEHEGDAFWWITTTEANGGRHSAQAGDIEDDQTSTLKLTHESEEAGSISFFVKTSSEAGWDQLFFRINGHEMDSWSGESEWTEVSYPVEAGSHTYTWSYEKDSSASDGEDTAWIDDITLPHAPTRNWVLIWSDEFDCNGLPDPNRWSYDVWEPGYVNEELQAYTYARSENARVEDGYLIITAMKEAYQGAQYTSARLKTLGLGDWTYGKVEVRAQLPTGRGLWPAIWMLPSDSVYGDWPASGEIDIMENVGFEPDKIHWTVHTAQYNHMIGTQKGTSRRFSEPYSQFYTYGLEWDPDSLRFLVDDVPYFRFYREGDDYQVWPFDHPFHLVLNIAVGGTWGGARGIDTSVFPQEMLVDYVRIYRLDEEAGPYTLDIVNLSNGIGFKTPDQETYEPGSMPHLSVEPYDGFEFIRWHGTIQSPDPNLVLNMYFDHTQIPEFTRPGEMLTNSQFLSGTRAWAYYGATVLSAEGELYISIPTTTPNPWSIQVSQGNIELEEGRSYTLYVTACAARNRTIDAVVGLDDEPWTVYAHRTLNLATRPQTFDIPFTMNTDQPNGRVALDVGRSLGDVYIQEVSLTIKNEEEPRRRR